MAPHDDEVHVECEPGDPLVYSGHHRKSGTFNGGREPIKPCWMPATTMSDGEAEPTQAARQRDTAGCGWRF
jgi:hypothetical protein